ncbi:penicillin-binding transpeptidase domain-containing protein [Pelagibius sp. Alg239-R121]|uniref:penicillin-binding transpeptidase domain-containing protein n=1 Tax=Pelagibius sp. Alg239-R121 TaxID=2993448 RepID=UPI0024A66CBA|nr:penicillin-binding transpeptidase domain-containing protein [Pelagibius sp. Alg239-R121]
MMKKRSAVVRGAAFLTIAVLASAPALLLAATVSPPEVIDVRDLSEKIGEREVVFYALDLENGESFAVQPGRLDEPHSPWSTFKVPNLLIALESGVAGDLDYAKQWDQEKYPARDYWPKAWRNDHTLRSAFKHSVVWYFKEIALEVGLERYRQDVVKFGYGNREIADKLDSFWLGDPLEISPREQVAFLTRLLSGELGVSDSSMKALGEVSMSSAKDGFVLHGKTGAGPSESGNFKGPFDGWYVGWVERPDQDPLAYALYIKGKGFKAIQNNIRQDLSVDLLMKIGALPANWK